MAFDQRGHGCTHTGKDEDLSADLLVPVPSCTVVVIMQNTPRGGFGA